MTDFVYIMSPSYSGSTLLTFLLATHPSIATVGELKATSMGDVDEYDCSCGVRIRRCGFWQEVTRELGRLGIPFDVGAFGTHFRCESHPLADRLLRSRVRGAAFETARSIALRLLPESRGAYRRILDRNRALVDTIKHLQQADLFLDGSKDPVRLRHFLSARCWRIKVIHLIRDGRGKANSYMKHYRTTMEAAALEWRRTHEECERLTSRLPAGTCLRMHYEDLCREPDGTLAGVFEFLGLDPRQAARNFHSLEQHVIGNSMRLGSSSEIVLDEKWRTTLKPDDLATFERIAGELNRRYGYG